MNSRPIPPKPSHQIAEDHQQYVEELLDAGENSRQEYFATRIGIDDPAGEPLTDATDDFDYVFTTRPRTHETGSVSPRSTVQTGTTSG